MIQGFRFQQATSKIFYSLSLFQVLFTLQAFGQEVIPTKDKNQIKFAFGSCNKFTPEQQSEIFDKIALQNPDSFAWLGDAAYIDIRKYIHYWEPDPSEESIKRKFDNVVQDQHYKKLLQTNAKIIGVWDDHDYNMNDGGKDFEGKYIIQRLYLDFLNEPSDSPRRSNQQGIYVSYYLGEEKRVKVILLGELFIFYLQRFQIFQFSLLTNYQTDVRFNRDHRRDPNPTDMLGEAQWKWLEQELSDKSVLLYLVASGTQVIPDDRFFQEQWYNPSRQRLLQLIRDKKAPVVLLSGDIHQAELMEMPCSDQYLGYSLREITSSGLSFTNTEMTSIFPLFKYIVQLGVPPTFSSHQIDRYLERNYGMVNIEWNNTDIMSSTVQLHIYGNITLAPVLAQEFKLYDFHPNPEKIKEIIDCPIYNLTPTQRKAQNFLVLLQKYDPAAIIVALLGGLLFMNLFKFMKALFSACCRGSQNEINKKIKKD
ncbi:hypothetical protein ABPG72_000282 [Tetrahymena utriculariae]